MKVTEKLHSENAHLPGISTDYEVQFHSFNIEAIGNCTKAECSHFPALTKLRTFGVCVCPRTPAVVRTQSSCCARRDDVNDASHAKAD